MSGKIAIVAGAGRGMGSAVAHRLLRSGYRVALVSRTPHQLTAIRDTYPAGRALAVPVDVTDDNAADLVFESVEDQLGSPGILIYAAGHSSVARLIDTTDELIQDMLNVNLVAPFRFMRRALPGMIEARFGRIVVIASIAAKTGLPYRSAYAAAKHGIVGAVRCAAAEAAATGVTVNAVCPAYVDTSLTQRTIDRIAAIEECSRAAARRQVEQLQPIQRMISVDEVATTVAFLVETPAVTGQAVHIDGGFVHG